MFTPLVQELWTAERLGLWTGTEHEGQLDNREYSTNLIYSRSDKQSDSRDKDEAVASGLDREGINWGRRERREVRYQSAHTWCGVGVTTMYLMSEI